MTIFLACLMIARELEKAINEVDPKKKVSVGSFRVDPKGNQKINDVCLELLCI